MRRLRDKTTLVLILYSIITFIIFIIGSKYIINISNTNNIFGIYDQVYPQIDNTTINPDVKPDITYSGKELILNDSNTVSSYKETLNNNLSIVTMAFFIFIVVSNFLLITILNRLDLRKSKEIAMNIKSIEDEEDILSLDPIMSHVYKELKDKFDSHMQDYKRLNSYLSHEQKNAIAILRTSLELKGDEELIKTLDKVSDSVEDILAISDINNFEDMHEIDVALLCAEVCDHYSKVYKNLYFDFDEDDNMSIYGKEKWIYRGISNLLDNAIKYGRGKDIYVKVRNEKSSVIISVQDNGIGMNKSSMQKIFYDRFRINDLNKDGYGIGLSLVKHVCSLCDGFVWVESEEGKGSTFYLVFKEYK